MSVGRISEAAPPAKSRRKPHRPQRDFSYELPFIEHADAHARELKALLGQLVRPIGAAARPFVEKKAWTLLGYARANDYAREILGRSGRWLYDRARLERVLLGSPKLEAAFSGSDGGTPLGQVAILGIERHANPATLNAWIERARAVSVRELLEDFRRASEATPTGKETEIGCLLTPRERLQGAIGHDVLPSWNRRRQLVGEPDDPDAPCLFKANLNAAASAAFQVCLELHRAVYGRDENVVSFVEALVAEHRAGPLAEASADPDAVVHAIASHVEEEESVEVAARAAAWEPSGVPLPRPELREEEEEELATSRELIERARALIESAGQGSLTDNDQQLRELRALEDELLRALGDVLLSMRSMGSFGEKGQGALPFTSVGHYASQRLGISRSQGERLVRLASKTPLYPELHEAYRAGRLTTEAALLVLRAIERGDADADTIEAWIERAAHATVKRLRDEVTVARRERALNPGEPARGPLTDDEWYSSLRRTPGQTLAEILELARESQSWGQMRVKFYLRLPRALAHAFLEAIESVGRALAERGPGQSGVGAGEETFSHRMGPRGRRGSALHHRDVSNALLLMLIDYAETWDHERNVETGPAEATYQRDGYRCMAPGCTSRSEIEEHHIKFRSAGGSEDPTNRLSLCRFHHQRGVHGGLMNAYGKAGEDLIIHLGRPDLSVCYRNELR